MQVAKKKLVLDHVIVQRMDDTEDAGNDVQSVLMHGAQTLFTDEADQSSRDITCEWMRMPISSAKRSQPVPL